MRIADLTDDVYDALQGRDIPDERIEKMTANEIFDEYCEWEGLANWGPALRGTLDRLRAAE